MKFLVLVQSLEKGGRTVRFSDTVRGLMAHGHSLRIITFSPLNAKVPECLLADIDVEVCLKSEGFDLLLLYRIIGIFKKGDYDLIHAHCETSYLYGGCRKASRCTCVKRGHVTCYIT